MARQYAVVLALIAMIVVLLQAVKSGAGLDGTMITAWIWMGVLGAVGLIVGAIAEATIDESVRTQIEAELAANSGEPTGQPTVVGG